MGNPAWYSMLGKSCNSLTIDGLKGKISPCEPWINLQKMFGFTNSSLGPGDTSISDSNISQWRDTFFNFSIFCQFLGRRCVAPSSVRSTTWDRSLLNKLCVQLAIECYLGELLSPLKWLLNEVESNIVFLLLTSLFLFTKTLQLWKIPT